MRRRSLLIGLSVAALLVSGAVAYKFLHHSDYVVDAGHRMARGDLRGAELELNQFLNRHPRDPAASFKLGMLNLAEENPIAAERNLRIARDGGYDPKLVTTPLGESYLRQRKFDEALNDFQVGNVPPQARSEVLSVRASAYLGLNRVIEAREAAADGIKAAPDAVEPKLVAAQIEMTAGDLQAASSRVDEALAKDPNQPEALLLKGELAMHHSDVATALKYAEQVRAAHPERVDAKMAVARALSAAHRDLEASRVLDEVLKRAPRDIGANYLRVILAVRQHDFATADASLAVISPVVDRLPQGLYFFAITKLGRNQPEAGQEAAAKYAARHPEDIAGTKLLAFAELAVHRPDRAMDVIKPLIAKGNPDADTLDLEARAQAMMGDMHAAETNLARASALQPENPEFINRLAASKLGQGEIQAGEADLRRSLTKQPDQPIAAQTLVQTSLAAGDVPGAQAAVDQLRKAVGDTELVGVLDAQVKVANLDLDGAKAMYEDVLKRFPDSRDAIFGLVQAEGRLGDAKHAEERLAGWMANHPTDKQGLTVQIRALTAAGDPKGAIAAAERAHAGDPSDADITEALAKLYLTNKQPDRAVALLDRAQGTPNALLNSLRGQALVQVGREDDARKAFQQAQEAAPNALGPRFGALELALHQKDYTEAHVILDEAQRLAPGTPAVLEAMVAVDLKESGIQTALETAEKLKQDPQNMPTAMMLPGRALEASGDAKRATEAYVAAFKEMPSRALAAAAASSLTRAGRTADAKALLTGWVARDPKDVNSLQVLASMALSEHRWDDASRLLDQILAVDHLNPVALNNAAWTRLHAGDSAGALNYAQRAYFLAPGAETEDTLGWLLVKNNNSERGLQLLQQSAAARPKGDIMYHYGVALHAQGHDKDARAAVQRALADKNPFDERPDAEALLAKLPPSQ